MVYVKVGLFDRYALKPLWVIYIALFMGFFINGAWLVGGFLVVMLIIISFIGQALHPNMTVAGMSQGTTPGKKEINDDINRDELTDIEAILISMASHRIALLNGITTIVISWHALVLCSAYGCRHIYTFFGNNSNIFFIFDWP
jgi:hypothetical protein